MPGRGKTALLPVLAMLLALMVARAAPASAAGGTAWTVSGSTGATVVSDGTVLDPTLHYSYILPGGGVPTQTWTFQTTATATGNFSVPYTYSGFHAYYQVRVFLRAFVTHNSVTTTTTLISNGPVNCCTAPSGGFSYAGTHGFDLAEGDTYGFVMGGSNYDSNSTLIGTFTAHPPAGPAVPESAYTVDAPPENTSWATATTLQANDTTTDAIDQVGQQRWYRFPVQPDSQVQVTLSNLPADDDIALFSDIGKAFAANQEALASGTTELTKLTAQLPGNASSPSIFSPSIFSPSIFSPSIFSPSIFSPTTSSPSIFSPSIFSPSIFSPSIFSPSIFSPSIFSPSIFSPSIFSPTQFQQSWASAQIESLLAVSTQRGTVDKTVKANTWSNTGYFYVRVSGYNGAAADGAFTLTVATTGGPCGSPMSSYDDLGTINPVPGSAQTVILTDSTRLPMASLTTPLQQLATATDGAVVDVSQSPRVAALNAQADDNAACPYAKNLVAQAIRDIVNGFRDQPGSLKYVVVVGDDDVIPFFRYADGAGLAPESDYVPPLLSTTAAAAALTTNKVLSDVAYGAQTDLALKGSTLPIPDAAVGRLVETPAEIAGTIGSYLATQTITPTSSLVTGYDFMQPAADQVKEQFADGLGTNDELVTTQGVAPTLTTVGGVPDRSHSWTAADLKKALLGTHHDLVFLGGHFSANNTLAADYSSTLVTTDLQQAAAANPNLFRNSLVLSAGCHGGKNLEDGNGVPGVTLGLDWPQAFAQAGATLISGTGYQYGDTDFVAYSDKLYVEIAKALRSGDSGPVSVGQALLQASQAYLAGVTQLSGLDQKSYLEATLYGLPMLGVTMPGHRTGTPNPTSDVTATGVGGGAVSSNSPGVVLGLQQADLQVVPDLQTHHRDYFDTNGSPAGQFTWLSNGPDGVVANPGEPALPVVTQDVTVDGKVLRGVGFRSGTYDDTTGITPLTGAPTTELNAVHTAFVSPAFYPQNLWNPNYYDALTGPDGRTTLQVTPAQHRSDAGSSTTDTLRAFSDMGLRLFYSSNSQTYGGNTPALAGPPTISSVSSTDNGDGSLSFSAHVAGDPSAGIQTAWVTYTAKSTSNPLHGTWKSLDLTQSPTDSTLWEGTLPANGEDLSDVSFMVQAVSGVGLVSLDNNGGYYYKGGVVPGVPATATPYGLAFDAGTPTTGLYGGTATVGVTLTGDHPAGRTVTVGLGGSTVAAVTDATGHASATVPLSATPGSYALSASFAGADDAQPASKDGPAFQISKAPTSLTLTGPTGPVDPGSDSGVQAVLTSGGLPLRGKPVYFSVTNAASQLVASVVGATDLNGAVQLGSGVLPSGGLTVTAQFGVAGVQLLNSGSVDASDPVYGPSSGTVPLEISRETSTTLVVQPNPATFGDSVTLTATVSPTNGNGSVLFRDGNVTVSGCGAKPLVLSGSYRATCTVTGLSVGPHSFTATYSGTAGYLASSSVATAASVAPAATSTSLSASPATPTFGQTVTLTATVSPTDGGTVAFYADGSAVTACATRALSLVGSSWQATCSLSGLEVGPHLFAATYAGDTNYLTSSATPLSKSVGRASTGTTLSASPTTPAFGQPVTLTAVVAPTDGGGTVAFSADGVPVTACATRTLDASYRATCTLTGLGVGPHTFGATYSGDTRYLGSTASPASATVTIAQTTTTLTRTPASPAFGAPVVLTAVVAPVAPGAGTPTGSVTFKVGADVVGVAFLSSGSASVTVNGLVPGPNNLRADYAGSPSFGSSTGTSTVTVAVTQTIAGTSAGSLTVLSGQQVLITGTVKGSVTVQTGGALVVNGGTIGGSLTVNGAKGLRLCGAKVGGSLSVSSSTGFVDIGGGTGCPASVISGPTTLNGNTGGLRVAGSTISGSLTVTNNSGLGPVMQNGVYPPPIIAGNSVAGSLACSGNNPPPSNAGVTNTAKTKSGQCASL